MKIHTLKALKDNFIYVLSHEGRAVVIDPGEAPVVDAFIARHNLRLEKIFCTHHHWDHTDGVGELVKNHGAEVSCSAYDTQRIPGATKILSEDQTYSVLGEEMRVLAVPGHTLGQIALWFPKVGALFAGDTLFSCGCGRLFEGTHQQMFESLQKIKALPTSTNLYFGHEYTLNNIRFLKSRMTANSFLDEYQRESEEKLARGEPTSPGKLATELKLNPFLSANDLATFTEWREARNLW